MSALAQRAAAAGSAVAFVVTALVGALSLAPSASAAAMPRAASASPIVVNTTTDDIQEANDEAQPVGWNRLIYTQKGASAFARVVVDDDEPVRHDGSLRLSTPNAGDALDIRYRTDGDVHAPRVPVATLATSHLSIKVTSGPAPAFTVDGCAGVMLQYVGAIPTDGQWHTIDLSGDAQPVWQLGGASPQTLDQVLASCPKGAIRTYGFVMSTAGSEAYVDDVSVGGLTTNFWVPPLLRLAGADRSRTACAMAQHYFTNGGDIPIGPESGYPVYVNPTRVRHAAKAVVLVNDAQFADALTAGPLAALADGPLLFNHGPGLDTRCGEISLSDAGTAYLVGGTGVLSTRVEAELKAMGVHVVRLAGPDRYQTAVAVATAIDGLRPANLDPQVFLASGTDFPDALSSGAPAGQVRGAVLLTQGARMAPATAAYLATQPSATVYAIGGQAAQAADLPAEDELVGANRYETATLVADRFFPEPTSAAVASGVRFPDAVSAGAYGGNVGAPVILVGPDGIPTTVFHYARAHRDTLRGSVLLGGTGAVNRLVFDLLSSELTPPR
jgi:hypothetical protein